MLLLNVVGSRPAILASPDADSFALEVKGADGRSIHAGKTRVSLQRLRAFDVKAASVVKVDAKQRERKREHWQAIATSACEQCGRNRVPEIGAPVAIGDSLAGLPADGLRCLLAADAEAALARAATGNRQPLVLLIGPEGGLADNERSFARANCMRKRLNSDGL